MDKQKFIIDKVVFNEKVKNYNFKATWLNEPKGESLIEIIKDDVIVKEFLFPSYKVFNIIAHAQDIIDGLEEKNDNGIYIAGSTGLGGNVYNKDKEIK